MILTSPLPDEVALGYAGRLRILNQAQNSQQFGYRLRDNFRKLNDERPSLVGALLLAAEQPPTEFLRHHSLIGYHRAVTKRWPEIPHGDPSRPDLIDYFGIRLINNESRFCPSCVEQDQQEHDVAYWHRTHQLPGIYWCPEHGDGLHSGPEGSADFWRTPDSIKNSSCAWSADNVSEMAQSEPLKKYVGIMRRFLDAHIGHSLPRAKDLMRELLWKHNIRVKLIGNEPPLGNIVEQTCPKLWFRVEYGWRKSGPEDLLAALDLIASDHCQPKAYAIALAVTHRSIEDACSYWHQDYSTLT